MYRPPGDLRDFDAIVGQGEAWHQYIQAFFAKAINEAKKGLKAVGNECPGILQFYDASLFQPVGETLGLDIVWNAFPNDLLRRFGREEAMRQADTLWPLPAYQLGWRYDPYSPLPSNNDLVRLLRPVIPYAREPMYRPQTEYCEWHVHSEEGRIRRVTFTCEPPEYWQAMFGGPIRASTVVFPGSSDLVLSLYGQLVDATVNLESVLATGVHKRTPLGTLIEGGYDPYNRWNTSKGIAHLCAPPNALIPEIMLAAKASRTYKNSRSEAVVLPDVLVAGAGLGDANRNSDVAIASTVNALVRQGRWITLSDPVGICMDHVDVSGWEFPGDLRAADCLHIVRGQDRQILRLVVEVTDPRFSVSDIRIGGVPIRYGGQIAECITVKLRAIASGTGLVANEPMPLTVPALTHPRGGSQLFPLAPESIKPPSDTVSAFEHEASPEAPGLPAPLPGRREDLDEPVLELEQIQGLAVPGFLKPHQTLLCVRHGLGADEICKVKDLLSWLVMRVSTGLSTLDDRNAFRSGEQTSGVLLGIGFTWIGLRHLTASAESIQSEAFRQGLAARSALLGDSVQAGEPGHPSRWVVGGPGNTPCFMIVVAGQDRGQVNRRVDKLSKRLAAAGCTWQRQDGDKLDKSAKSREHFGFVDGISQPGIRGRVPNARRDFVTPIRVAEWPASGLYGYPGQDLIWPGEFVLGYAKSGPDPLLPGPVAVPDVAWMKNGSYLVYNRLVQDVGLFWKTMTEEAERLSAEPGFEDISAEGLASRLVGRTRNGVPISRLQGSDQAFHEGLGSKPWANNNFRFESDTPRLHLLDGADTYPRAKADPLGMVCPLAAHIRKLNPRDSASDIGGECATHQHRILRTGVSFGPKREILKSAPAPDEPERGQLFLCIQASIEAQFEFLQSRWMNDDVRPRAFGGHDMLAGRNPPTGGGDRRCTIFGAQGPQQVHADTPFVTSSGGGYFFVPSVDAIKRVLAGNPP